MGAHGPFVVIQNHGSNEYIIDSDDLYTGEGKLGSDINFLKYLQFKTKQIFRPQPKMLM